ncbi:uncharacterized protein LOC131309482 [Rhododendron vialii]|uniref:uncharacterized protein LOC131309482 n=1 Tax=Rhododendron vialii TaxID=182163 RepID=UPI00265F6202|nr:uncharacterized protein LOC131309482 [Rhododendron vialii]
MAAALNRFISKSSDKCHAFFHALKGKSRRSFEWTSDCNSALAELKEYLNSTPLLVKPKEFETLYLYLAISTHATSSALVRRDGTDDMPIYFTSKTLLPAQTRYLPLEKLALALVSAARKLLPYFQSHPIVVLTEHPLKSLFRKADLSNRVFKWAVELANFDIHFEPRTKIQNFSTHPSQHKTIAEHQVSPKPWHLFQGDTWRLHVDGASNSNGAGVGVVLVSTCGTLHESAISIEFLATNNEAEYEALIAGLRSAVVMEISDLVVYSSKASEFKTISFGSIDHPSFDTTPEILNVELGPSWMDEIIAFLKHDTLPADKKEAYRIKNKAAYYWLSESDQLYKKSFSGPYLLVVHPTQVPDILTELHSGKLPTTPGGFKFLITATDYFSKWVEAEPLVTTTKVDVRRFVWRNIVTRFGVPYAIVSDNGSQFVGNGQAEATNKTVSAGIKRRLNSKRGKWAEELPCVLWAYRTTPRRSTGQTPFSMVFGMEAVIPLESRFPTLRTENFDPKTNDEAVEQELILVDEKRDDARLRLAKYQ